MGVSNILHNITKYSLGSNKYINTRVNWTNFTQCRYESSNTTNLSKVDHDNDYKVVEEVISVRGFDKSLPLPEKPIASLDIVKRINKIDKIGSFAVDLFLGKFDQQYLTYPDPVYDKIECEKLLTQSAMVKQIWPKIWDDEKKLQKFNFYNLYQLSVTEMMSIYEAIGESSQNYHYDIKPSSNKMLTSEPDKNIIVTTSNIDNTTDQYQLTRAILTNITRNCLTYWPLNKSHNEKLKQALLPKKHILYGGMKDEEDLLLPLNFAWSEKAPSLGSLPPQEWSTTGLHGGEYANSYALSGKKNKVLIQDRAEHYLVFFKDAILSKQYENGPEGNEPNPAADPFIGCCLVHKSELLSETQHTDLTGFKYTDIQFDTIVPTENEVFPAKRRSPFPLNIKALGQVATCAVEMGIMKSLLKQTYEYLMETKVGLLNCEIVQQKLAIITSRIFALESMIYYLAGMYDGLADGFDAHMEAGLLKIATIEYCYDTIRDIQQLCGVDMLKTSRLQDQLNIFDSFLDGAVYNRIYISTLGVMWFARVHNINLNQLRLAPWFPGNFLKEIFKKTAESNNFLTLDADIEGHLHPSLKDAAVNLEFLLKRVKFATQTVIQRYGGDVTKTQIELSRLGQLVLDTFILTAVCARASKSYSNATKNSEIDVALASIYSQDVVRRLRIYLGEIEHAPVLTIDIRAKIINELNLKNGGYFAASPLDPNI